MNRTNFHLVKKAEYGEWRGSFLYVVGKKHRLELRKEVEVHLEVLWKKKVSPGFRIHFGNKSSETPFDWTVSVYWLALYGSLVMPGLGDFCEWVGRGHKRDISLRFHHGKMWWNLWYDNDRGYDDWHKHDLWKHPTIWPWSRGRKKYRSWMCLRSGNIDLNPIDALWGTRKFISKKLEEDTLLIEVNAFVGDEYMVNFIVNQVALGREYGPKWARKETLDGYSASWYVKDGIPIQNHDWKGDNVYASAFQIPDPIDWRLDADQTLVAHIIETRFKNHYQLPTVHMSDDFENREALINEHLIISTIDPNDNADPNNELIKELYSPEELATQAINRDKEDS